MIPSAPTDLAEVAEQQVLLRAAIGNPGSGAVRYAAAMYFFNRELMSAEMLEIYRRCCKFDREDPIDLANFEGVETPQLAMVNTPMDKR